MASSSVDTLKTSRPENTFCIFNNGKFQYPEPIVVQPFIPVVHDQFSPICDIFLPAVFPDTVLAIYPEHLGHFLTALTTDIPPLADITNVITTLNAVFSEKCDMPVDDNTTDPKWWNQIVGKLAEIDWSITKTKADEPGLPLHLAYNVVCGLYAKSILKVAGRTMFPLISVITAGFLEGHFAPFAAACYMKPMFPIVDNAYSLFKGYMIKSNMQDYSDDDQLRWDGEMLKKNMGQKVTLADKYPELWMFAPTAKDRMMRTPRIGFKQDASYELVDTTINETMNTDVIFGMIQSAFFAGCRNMCIENSIYYDQEAVSELTFDEFLTEVTKESISMADLVLKEYNTVLKIISAHVMVSSEETNSPFGCVAPMSKDPKTHIMSYYGGFPDGCLAMDMLKATISQTADASAFVTKLSNFSRGLFSSVRSFRGFRLYGTYSAFNSYGSCVDAVNLTTTGSKEMITDFTDPGSPKYAFFMTADSMPFCYATLGLVLRQVVLGTIVSIVLPVGTAIAENIKSKFISKEIGNAVGKVARLVIPFRFPKPTVGDSADSDDNEGKIYNTFDIRIGNQTVKNKVFTKSKNGRNIKDIQHLEFLKPCSDFKPSLNAILKKNIKGMVETVLQNHSDLRFIPTLFLNNEHIPISHQSMMAAPAGVVGSPVFTDVYVQMYRRTADVVLSIKWTSDMQRGAYIVRTQPNSTLTLKYRRGYVRESEGVTVVQPAATIDIQAAVMKLVAQAKGLRKTINVSTINSLFPLIDAATYAEISGKLVDLKINIQEDDTPAHAKVYTQDDMDEVDSDTDSPAQSVGTQPQNRGVKRPHGPVQTAKDTTTKIAKMMSAVSDQNFTVDSDDE